MDFIAAFKVLIGNERGYVNDPAYPGGETKFGISKRSYPGEDIAGMTLERAQQIYLREYWGPAGCDAVPDALKFDLFDMAVNQGVKPAIKALQHAAGQIEDGVLGPHTVLAVQALPPAKLLFRFDAARLVHYAEVNDTRWLRFGRGWVRRVAANMVQAAA